ncbi:MAG: uroporphyrinogen-III C-methyltransferase [Pseudomonadota bacterium]
MSDNDTPQDDPNSESPPESNDSPAPTSDKTPKTKPARSKLPLYIGVLAIFAVAIFWGWTNKNSRNDAAAEPEPTQVVSESQEVEAPQADTADSSGPEPATAQPTAAATTDGRDIAPDLVPAATQADIDNLRREIATLRSELADLSVQLTDQAGQTRSQAQTLTRLRSEQQDRLDMLDSLPGRVRNTEEALARLQGISAGSQRAWLLAEAEYYMQLANAQLQLANNPELASEALRLADQRVRELADPVFTPVRRALADEIASLATLSTGDVEGASLTIGSLMSMVDRLPIDQDVRRTVEADDALPESDDTKGWARMRDKIGGALSSFVRVRKSDAPLEPLLPQEAESFLRLNLKLQLQSARSALLLGEHAAYRQGLNDVRDWVTQYFDTDDSGVQSLLGMIDDVDDAQRSSARPDISGSLTLLREQLDVEGPAE